MKSLRLRVALWFAVSVTAVMGVFVAVTFTHLRHELRVEKWERASDRHPDWLLHGSYSETEVADIVGELWYLSLIYATPVLLLAMGAGYFVARRAFAPVAEMSSHLQRIGARSLDQRLNTRAAPQELQELGEGINALLIRLENSFHQLSDFSAQVAHELRTPLTLMRLQIEESAGRIEPALAESMQEELRRLSDYVEQCLLLATAEQGRLRLSPERLRLGEVVRDVVEAYALLAREEHRTINLAVEDIEIVADPRYLRQLLHILLSNALRHGEGSILVSVSHSAGRACCEVVNRIRSGRTGRESGTGLGLRLGKALAGALAAQWQVASTADGRYTASLGFPPAPPLAPGVPV